jgi:hypothetical protein
MIVGRDAASGKRAKRVHACLHSLRESVFTMLRVIDASIIAMSVADDSRRPTIRWDATVKCQAPSAWRAPTVIGLVLQRQVRRDFTFLMAP